MRINLLVNSFPNLMSHLEILASLDNIVFLVPKFGLIKSLDNFILRRMVKFLESFIQFSLESTKLLVKFRSFDVFLVYHKPQILVFTLKSPQLPFQLEFSLFHSFFSSDDIHM